MSEFVDAGEWAVTERGRVFKLCGNRPRLTHACCWRSLQSRRLIEIESILFCPSAGTLMAEEADSRPEVFPSGCREVSGLGWVQLERGFFRLSLFSSRVAQRLASKELLTAL